MKTGYWLRVATQFLQSKAITTARLDCLVLLEDTIKHERGWILAHPEYELSDAAVQHLQNLLSRRARHEPLAYIRGRAEFYGRSFRVSPNVLVPRPESEAMIELLLDLPYIKDAQKIIQIADIGTGSGALGITAALELEKRGIGVTKAQVTLTDIDDSALKIAQFNVDKMSTGISIVKSDLLDTTQENFDILLCNLPYVPDDYQINKAATHEPKLALFAGADGLDLYRKLFEQTSQRQMQPLYILTESLPEQHAALTMLANKYGYSITKTNDFIQQFER